MIMNVVGGNTSAQLRRDWRRWMRIVARCAGRRTGRPRITSIEYQALHLALLEACRSCADQSSELEKNSFQGMASLIQPWVSLESLVHANKPILKELLERGRAADRQLSGRRTPLRWPGSMTSMLLAAAVAALVGMVVVLVGSDLLPRMTYEARGWYFTLSSTIQRASFLSKFSLITVAVVLFGVWMLSNPRRY